MLEVDRCICCVLLGVLAWIDFRRRRIPAALLLAGVIIALIFGAVRGNGWQMLAGGAVGVIFLLVSYITREKIGYGDGIGILGTGIYLGIGNLLSVLLASFFFLGGYAVICMIRGKLKKETSVPFYPFLWAGYSLLWGLGGLM